MASGKEYSMLFKLNAELSASFATSFNSAKNPVLGLQTEINKLNKTQADISAYQKQQGAVDSTRKKLEMLQQQYDNIQQEMTETGNSSAAMKNKLIAKQNQIDRTSESLKGQTDKLNTMDTALGKAGISTKDLASESRRLDSEMDELKVSQAEAARAATEFGNSVNDAFTKLQNILVSVGIAAGAKKLADGMAASAEAAIAYESAMAGVDKTTDLSRAELAAMADEFQRLSTIIPVSANELAGIAETAGQLGIAKETLSDFTQVMAKLSTATTMSAQEGATMLAQFANITQMDPAHYERLASSVVDLGNKFATTEQKIIDMSQGMAASANLAGMSEADILGLSAAISALGIEAQAGSTSASKLITQLDKATKTGKGLEDFARVAGVTASDFKAAWGEDAAGALSKFITGLNDTERHGKSATVILEEMGITEVRMQRMMLSLAGSGDLMNRALETSNQAWRDNTALQEEAEKRYGTTESKVDMARNAFDNLKVTLGEHLTPIIGEVAEAFNNVVTGITDWMDKNPELTKAILTGVGIFAAGAAGVGIYTTAVNAAKIAMDAMKLAIPGVGWVIGGIAALALVGGAYILLSEHINNNRESFEKLDEKFDESMTLMAENSKIQGLIDEYGSLNEEVNGGRVAVEEYQKKQQALWDAYSRGNITSEEYKKKLGALRQEYADGVTATDEYWKKEDELWKAFATGEKPIMDYVEEVEKLRAKHAETQSAVETYKGKEEELWEAYTDGELSVEQYNKKLLDLRTELGLNSDTIDDLAGKQARLAKMKQELRDKSDGLITATDEETEAFSRQVKALETIIRMEQDQARAKALENLTKQAKFYAQALDDERINTEYLTAAQEKQNEVVGIIGSGYESAIERANELGDAMTNIWDDETLTDTQKWERHNELVEEAGRLMSILTGAEKDYSGNPLIFFYDLDNLEEGSTQFRKSWEDANEQVSEYQGLVFAAQDVQDEFLQNLVDGVRIGGITLAEYETMLRETFSGYENGAQIVADIMAHVARATQEAATSTENLGAGMATTEEQALALQTTIDAAKAKVDELSAAYTKVYDSALQSINGQLRLFEELKKPEKTLTSDQMLKTLNAQAAYLDTYTANIRKATELGVAPELVKQLSDGSVESAAYLQTIVNSGNEKITELNAAFEKVEDGKETFASTLADIQTNFTETMDSIQADLEADIAAMNLNVEAAQSGKDTIQGFIDGAEKMLGPVKTAYAKIAAAAAAALKVELDINSPSEVTTEIGEFTGMGLIEGAMSQEEDFRKAMESLANAGIDAYRTSSLLDALGPGYFEHNGRIFVQPQKVVTAKPSAQAASTVSLKVAPVYNFAGNTDSETLRSALTQHDIELKRMVLDIVAEADFDQRRRSYDEQ